MEVLRLGVRNIVVTELDISKGSCFAILSFKEIANTTVALLVGQNLITHILVGEGLLFTLLGKGYLIFLPINRDNLHICLVALAVVVFVLFGGHVLIKLGLVVPNLVQAAVLQIGVN